MPLRTPLYAPSIPYGAGFIEGEGAEAEERGQRRFFYKPQITLMKTDGADTISSLLHLRHKRSSAVKNERACIYLWLSVVICGYLW
jgi:hypothetical protein